jgi:protein ImuB
LGSRAVRRLVPRASHLPELAQSLKSAFAGTSPWPEPLWRKPQRPPLLFTRPEPLTVLAEIPEGPPARFTWRRVTHRVVKSEGPERIAPEWWRSTSSRTSSQARQRDYYRIEDEDGHRYWVFRDGLYQDRAQGSPSWYLHGVFG